MALAVVVVGVLHALLPDSLVLTCRHWVYQVVLLVFLVVLVIGDPGRVDVIAVWLRVTSS